MSNPILFTKVNVAETFRTSTLLDQMSKFNQNRAEKTTTAIRQSYETDINAVNRTADRWKGVREDIESSQNVLRNMAGRVKSLRTSINNMISNVNKAELNADEGTGAEIYSASFDALLKGLDTAAQKGNGVNLLSSTKTTLSYKSGINGTSETVNSAYVGSNYHIVDDEGKYWDLDRDAKILKRYDSYPDEPTSTAGNFQTGIRLDNLTGDSISFTIGPDTADAQSFSGTLYRSGLEILDSWAYGGFKTSEGRAQALDDLNAAKAALDLEVRRYEIALTTANFYESMADQAIKGYRDQTDALMIEQVISIQEAQKQLARDYQTSSNTLAQSLSIQNGFAKMFQNSFAEGSLAEKLVNILA